MEDVRKARAVTKMANKLLYKDSAENRTNEIKKLKDMANIFTPLTLTALHLRGDPKKYFFFF